MFRSDARDFRSNVSPKSEVRCPKLYSRVRSRSVTLEADRCGMITPKAEVIEPSRAFNGSTTSKDHLSERRLHTVYDVNEQQHLVSLRTATLARGPRYLV